MPVGPRTRHLRSLARAHGTRYRCHKDRPPFPGRVTGQAWPARGCFSLRTHGQDTEDEEAYFVALHELAHIVQRQAECGGGAQGATADCVVEYEAEAWCWALDHALHQPSTDVAESLRGMLWSYWERYRGLTGAHFRRAGRLLGDKNMASPLLATTSPSSSAGCQSWQLTADEIPPHTLGMADPSPRGDSQRPDGLAEGVLIRPDADR